MEKGEGGLLETGVRAGSRRFSDSPPGGGGGGCGWRGGQRTPDTAVGETAVLPSECIHDTSGPGTTLRGVSTQLAAAGKKKKDTYTPPVRAALCAQLTLRGVSPAPSTASQRSTHTSPRAALAPNLALAPAGAAVAGAEIDTGPALAAPQARAAAAGAAVAVRGDADLAGEQCWELDSGVEVEVEVEVGLQPEGQ